MAGNSIGELFRVTTFGESHGNAVGCVVDGCPAGLEISELDIQKDLDRRKPGQNELSTPRKEADEIVICSGIFEGKTTGTPIMMYAKNADSRPQDYDHMKDLYRPSHADYTYDEKYGNRDYRGGGRSSARTTLAVVAAGAIARKYLAAKGMEFLAYTEQVGDIVTDIDYKNVKFEDVEANHVHCPDSKKALEMEELIKSLKREGDSVGGVIRCVVRGVPVGLGMPVFDKLPADLGKAMLSINATKGFEFGSGFAGSAMKGSEHNDEFYMEGERVRTKTNNSGGTLGGISDGEDIHFRVAFKPVATILKPQHTVNRDHEEKDFRAIGRHDPCVLPRAVVIVEAMAAITVMDHYLRAKAYE